MDILELKNTVIKPNEKLSGKKKKAQWMARQQNGGYTEGKKSVKRMTGQHKLPNPSKREKRDRKVQFTCYTRLCYKFLPGIRSLGFQGLCLGR